MKNRLRLTAGILVIVLFVLIIGCVVYINLPSGRYERYLNLGNRYLLSADYENAVRAFSKAIEIDAKLPEPYVGRGDAYQSMEEYTNAQADYEKALNCGAADPEDLKEKIRNIQSLTGTETESEKEPEAEVTETPPVTPVAVAVDPEEIFKVQIETYRTAYNQHRNGGDVDIDADIVSHAIISPIYDTLGYAFVDFAEDDVPELVIGAVEGDSYYAWDIFAYDGTSVFRVSETGNYKGEELILLEGNYIKECIYEHTVSNIKVYRLEKDTSNKVTVFYVNNTEQTKEIQRNENEELRVVGSDECEQFEAEINGIPAMSGIDWIYF